MVPHNRQLCFVQFMSWVKYVCDVHEFNACVHIHMYVYTHLCNAGDAVILTITVCLCGGTANVALVHSILEHQTCGSVVGVGDQVVSEPLGSSISCVVK